MSRHHAAIGWPALSRRFRPIIRAALPLPCVDCGQLVMPDDKWQVGHRPGLEAMHELTPTIADVGPSHRKSDTWPRNCNQIAGGRIGAQVANANRRAKRTPRGRPNW